MYLPEITFKKSRTFLADNGLVNPLLISFSKVANLRSHLRSLNISGKKMVYLLISVRIQGFGPRKPVKRDKEDFAKTLSNKKRRGRRKRACNSKTINSFPSERP